MKGCAVHARTVVFVAMPPLNWAKPFGARPISPTQSSLTHRFSTGVAADAWRVGSGRIRGKQKP
jgi:hypothetical protein